MKRIDGLGEFELGLVHDTEPFEHFRLVRKLGQRLPIGLLRRVIVTAVFEFTRLSEEAFKGWGRCL